jgi:signal transduction histidine kinase
MNSVLVICHDHTLRASLERNLTERHLPEVACTFTGGPGLIPGPGHWDVVIIEDAPPGAEAGEVQAAIHDLGMDPAFIIISGVPEKACSPPADRGVTVVLPRTGIVRPGPSMLPDVVQAVLQARREHAAGPELDQLYFGLVEDLPDMVCLHGPDGSLVSSNRAFRDYFPRPPGPGQGADPVPTVHPDDRQRVRDHFSRLAGSTGPASITHRYLFPDQSERWVRWTNRAVVRSQGDLAGYFSVGKELAGRDGPGQMSLLPPEKTSLLGEITRHDVKNALASIYANTYLIREYSQDGRVLDCISGIEKSIKTINSHFTFAELYERIGHEEPAWVPLCETMNRAFEPFVSRVAFLCDIPGGLLVRADPIIEKAFYNLFQNAVEHGGQVTWISCAVFEKEQGLTVVVADNGVGIPADMKEKVFERGIGKNTGLGLFLVREIFSLTGIGIIETGSPGRGARFEITVPSPGYRFEEDGPVCPCPRGPSYGPQAPGKKEG